MVRLFYAFSPGFGAGHLPRTGGMLDQAAVNLDAFRVCEAARAAARKLADGKGDDE